MKTENGLLRKIIRKYTETSLILRILTAKYDIADIPAGIIFQLENFQLFPVSEGAFDVFFRMIKKIRDG